MREFDYKKLLDLALPAGLYQMLALIYEHKGRQALYAHKYPEALERMVEVAKVQSTRSSNAIEGISTNDTRLKALMTQKTEPRDRDEEEIAGYRRVLDLIYEHYPFIEINRSNVLALHKQLYDFSAARHRGEWKHVDNTIVERDALGNQTVRFRPVSSFETERAMEALLAAYQEGVAAEVPPLLLIPVFILDFLCIHPFEDGNGRMSRLLTLLLLERGGFQVGRYVSLELLIEESKTAYYEALQRAGEGWHEGQNDYLPFVRYFLGILLKAYEEADERFRLISEKKLSPAERVFFLLERSLKPLAKQDLLGLCPDLSQRTIERALNELHAAEKIRLVGRGRASCYIIN